MRVLLQEDVRTAAKRRIHWLFEEFPTVIVNHSGGKDSTVVFNLALEVAHELDRLPLKVCFLDTEAEWQATVDHMRDDVFSRDDVEPIWLQVPFRMYLGATSHEWFTCWDPAAKENWIHPQQPFAITENPWGAERFNDVLAAYTSHTYDGPVAKLLGIRGEESPARLFGMQSREVYKGETWGAVEDAKRGHFLFHPIYDWSFSDVWRAIEEGGWAYNRLYDEQYRRRMHPRQMRVADLTMGDMSRNALYLAEIEPDTYARLQRRMGPEAIERMEMRGWFPDRLPFMFESWAEYRDYLLENLVREKWRDRMRRQFERSLAKFPEHLHEELIRVQVGAVLIEDWKGTKIADWEAAHASDRLVDGKVG